MRDCWLLASSLAWLPCQRACTVWFTPPLSHLGFRRFRLMGSRTCTLWRYFKTVDSILPASPAIQVLGLEVLLLKAKGLELNGCTSSFSPTISQQIAGARFAGLRLGNSWEGVLEVLRSTCRVLLGTRELGRLQGPCKEPRDSSFPNSLQKASRQ